MQRFFRQFFFSFYFIFNKNEAVNRRSSVRLCYSKNEIQKRSSERSGVIALVASVFVVPKLFGINPYVVLSGSMEPQIHTGAIAFVNTKDTAVKVGDVVTYRLANDELVTHRIIKKDQSEYTFQGDANDNPDARTVTQDQIVGKYLFSIPKVGFLISALGKKGMPVIIAWIIILNIMSLILESTCSSGDKKKTAEPQNED